jgi:hypothetical protein
MPAEESILVTYRLEPRDYVRVGNRLARRQLVRGSIILTALWPLIGVAVGGPILAGSLPRTTAIMAGLVGGLVIGVGSAIALVAVSTVRRWRNVLAHPEVFHRATNTLQLSPRGLRLDAAGTQTVLPWASIVRFECARRDALFYLSPLSAITVPRAEIEAVAPGFADRVATWRDEAGVVEPEPLAPVDDGISLTWESTAEEWIALNRVLLGPQLRRLAVISVVLAPVLVLIVLLTMLIAVLAGDPLPLLTPALLGPMVVGVALFPWLYRTVFITRIVHRGIERGVYPSGTVRLVASPTGVRTQSSRGGGSVDWGRITSVRAVGGHVFLLLGERSGVVIPLRASTDPGRLAELLTTWHAAAGAAREPPPTQRRPATSLESVFAPPADQ